MPKGDGVSIPDKMNVRCKDAMAVSRKPVISVIVPVYNVKDYLGVCVDSILRQTFKDFELILVDDGSTDGSDVLCEELSHRDDRIICLHKENGGLSDARNYGIKYVHGTYVTFIDSDDWVEDSYLEYLYKNIHLQNSEISTCVFMIRYGDRAKPWKKLPAEPIIMSGRDALLSLLYGEAVNVSAHGKLYQAALFDDIYYPVGKRYEDVGTTYKLLYKSKQVVVGGAPLYNYVMRNGSITHTTRGIFDRYQLAQQAYFELSDVGADVKRAACRYMVFHALSVLRSCDLNNIEQRKQSRQIRRDILPYMKVVFFDKRTAWRDRFALCVLPFGLGFYQWAWSIYAKLTHRE